MEERDEQAGERWFERYVETLETSSVRTQNTSHATQPFYACPCCRCETLGQRGGFEICDVCGWEDDG